MKKEDFLDKLEKSKQQYKEGKVHSARVVFKELRKKYSHKVDKNKKYKWDKKSYFYFF